MVPAEAAWAATTTTRVTAMGAPAGAALVSEPSAEKEMDREVSHLRRQESFSAAKRAEIPMEELEVPMAAVVEAGPIGIFLAEVVASAE